VRRGALTGRGLAGGAAALAAAAFGTGLVLALERSQDEAEAIALPAPARPAFSIPRPTPIRSTRHTSRWALVVRPAAARAAPASEAAVVTRLGTRTTEGTPNVVLVLDNAVASGRAWVKVRLPVLPNNTTGWVARSTLGGYRTVETRLVVDRATLRATLLRNGRPVFRAPVGIGDPRWPTPRGEFYVRSRLRGFKSPFYGPLAFGTSARSSVLTDWPAGGFVGIHGTDRPELLPGQVSHGCIRMRNEDILELGRLMPIGTPVTIT
jgi:lipoprotein-anchoring transpeptidase ErfK/SrfK